MTDTKPVSAKKRIELIDALRGFAIFGILMVNMPLMFKPAVEMIMFPTLGEGTVEVLSNSFIYFFFNSKFFVLFSLLFGLGFYIFLHKDGEPNKGVLKLFRKRLFWLLVIGVLHVSLLWEGDILIYYALLGFILLLFRKSSIKKITIWIFIFLLIPIVFVGLISLVPAMLQSNPEALAAFNEGSEQQILATKDLLSRAYEVYTTGTYGEKIGMNWEQWLVFLPGIFIFYPTCMAMFLLGLIIGKKSWISNHREHLPFYRKVFRISLPVGILFNLLLVWSIDNMSPATLDSWALINTIAGIIGGISLMCTYVSGLVLLYEKGIIPRLTSWLSAAGRMALTNYIGHSLIAFILFRSSLSLGLFGKIEIWHGIGITVLIIVFQVIFSKWWLKKYRFGPLEWLWRTMTYGKVQPLGK